MSEPTRAQHLAWCKKRALLYADQGDLAGTLSSMQQDMDLHPQTAGGSAHMLGTMLAMSGYLSTPAELRKWVEDFQ